jgi:hypothetical protein
VSYAPPLVSALRAARPTGRVHEGRLGALRSSGGPGRGAAPHAGSECILCAHRRALTPLWNLLDGATSWPPGGAGCCVPSLNQLLLLRPLPQQLPLAAYAQATRPQSRLLPRPRAGVCRRYHMLLVRPSTRPPHATSDGRAGRVQHSENGEGPVASGWRHDSARRSECSRHRFSERWRLQR